MAAETRPPEPPWPWVEGELEVVPYHAVILQLSPSPGSARQPGINAWDLKKALKTITKDDPVFSEFNLRREKSTARLGYSSAEPVDALINAINGRVVPIGLAKLKAEVKRNSPVPDTDWKAHFFGAESDASMAVQEELFRRSVPGKGPDTLILRSLPCKWFGVRGGLADVGLGTDVLDGKGAEEDEERRMAAEAEALVSRMQALGWVSRAEAAPVASGLRFDAFVQFRKYADVLKALDILQGSRALHNIPLDLIVPLDVSVDTEGYMTDESIEARKQEKRHEREKIRASRRRRSQLEHERLEIKRAVGDLRYRAEKAGDEVENATTEAIDQLDQMLDRAKELDQSAAVGKDVPSMLADLTTLQARIKAQLSAAKRLVDEAVAEVEAKRRAEEEKRRKEEVQDLRVAKARVYKRLEQQWRDTVERHVGVAEHDEACKKEVDATDKKLAAAKALLLVEGAAIKDIEDYRKQLQITLAEADDQAAKAAGMLTVHARLKPLHKELAVVLEVVGTEGGGITGEQAGKKRRRAAGVIADSSDSENSGDEGQGQNWRWPFPRVFSQDPHVMESVRRAKAAMKVLEGLKGHGGQKEADTALDDLECHVQKVLGPKLRRHRACIPWAQRLDALTSTKSKVLQAGPSAAIDAVSSAEVAIRRAWKGSARGEGRDEEKKDEETMMHAVERAEAAVAGEEKRREEAHLREEQAEKERRETLEAECRVKTKARLEELQRRKAYLTESVRVQKARDRLATIRDGTVQACAASKPVVSKLLQAGGLSLTQRNAIGGGDDEDESVGTSSASVAEKAKEGGLGDSQVELVQPWERWRLALPLRLMEYEHDQSLANQVSVQFWAQRAADESAASPGVGPSHQEVHGPRLASEVFVPPKSLAPSAPAAHGTSRGPPQLIDEHDHREAPGASRRSRGVKRGRTPERTKEVNAPLRRSTVEVINRDVDNSDESRRKGEVVAI